MNFKQDGVPTEQVLRSVEAMITAGQFNADTFIFDGYDFGRPESAGDLKKFRKFASRLGLEVWFSASLKGEEPLFNERGVPRVFELLRQLRGAADSG